jgi:hypothetical protein
MEPTVCSPMAPRNILCERGDTPQFSVQGCPACFCTSMIVLEPAPADPDRPHNIALPLLQGNATREAY